MDYVVAYKIPGSDLDVRRAKFLQKSVWTSERSCKRSQGTAVVAAWGSILALSEAGCPPPDEAPFEFLDYTQTATLPFPWSIKAQVLQNSQLSHPGVKL